jgi:hypothetical protein
MGCVILLVILTPVAAALAQSETDSSQPAYLADRGPGLPTSLFGTYVQKGEWLIYPFFEYTRTSQYEYHPSELGFAGDTDFFGKLTEYEYLLYVSYGFSDGLSFELEGSLHTSATLEKAPEDTSALPDPLKESGVGDIQAELRWRWSAEGERRPEMFSWVEVVFPNQRDKVLIGTQDWEYELGFGVVKGHRWGTLTGRVALSYEQDEGQFGFGEYAVEYLKKLSPTWRFVGALEGESDELSAIFEGQATLGKHLALKLNSGFGLTRQAPEFAPEVGLLISF